ncbi:glycoside hydrolase family 3 C-terminal domain-containing protein [Muricauda sp. SCSIO 64092]|uniref:glycoside hydrolase family 3 protein n=1 Tax=Allomuricauda sp. SCSIO 64092 TaxID=2908842 RepID=UPI001FF12B77|nr:glycoside hydrolase family 3 N-terminal domain-containing protein [Muricauda sp. SCSIO 64092]UOY09237.1 glycoside hydrolase family 3 C-terminal domain-containing protein [Muricauda sp. SCSIO 64092]
MKKLLKVLKYILIAVLSIIVVGAGIFYFTKKSASNKNMKLLGGEAAVLNEKGIRFRDLNKNGKLDVYENPTAPIEARINDLIDQMTLEEKAGTMFVTMIGTTPKGEPMETPVLSTDPLVLMMSFALPSNSEMIARKKMNSFNILASLDAESMAKYANTIQKMAERTRLGIPITVATDPRHGTINNPGASLFTPAFSQWPSSLGLAATRDTVLVREFGDIARQEYRAVGIHLALHPMADLATEPRWARTNGTFGEDADLSAAMTKAYVLGFQGDSLQETSVACMTKHFSGGGPQKDGEDAHFPYGKEQVYPGNHFAYHVRPFTEGAFPAKTAQIMPYYGIPVGQTNEEVAFAFNKEIIGGLLRDSLNFKGVVCTDWNIITDSKIGEGRAWGVEDLSIKERVKKVLDAGCDQFGGEAIPGVIVELVNEGQIPEKRLDVSVKRILRDKFRLGLFYDPYVDEAKAVQIAGKEAFKEKGLRAQQKAAVLLKNEGILPLKKGTRIYVSGVEDVDVYTSFGEVVSSPSEADIIIARIRTPFDPRNDSFLESFFHQGRLYYNDEELEEIQGLIQQKPSVVVANLERPAILTPIDEEAKAVMADFGISDQVLAKLVFGEANPQGKMPFELPSSWEAVQKQLEDVPYDSENPLYPFGHGLSY